MASKKVVVDPSKQGALFSTEALQGPKGLQVLQQGLREVRVCTKCVLHETRTTVVYGEGRIEPWVAFVGEAPGATEDASGRPFVGKAGQQLTRMIRAMGLDRDEVFLTNATLCRPPENRTPLVTEINECRPHLYQQLRAVAPRAIVCLGRTAAAAVLGEARALEYMRGVWHRWEDTPVRVTFHPTFLIRPEGEGYKSHAWLDLQEVLRFLGLPVPSPEEALARGRDIPDLGWAID